MKFASKLALLLVSVCAVSFLSASTEAQDEAQRNETAQAEANRSASFDESFMMMGPFFRF